MSAGDDRTEPVPEFERDLDVGDPRRVPILRTLIAGGLMGAANLVPGVSGGTMVLVCGVYAHFVEAAADLTRLNFHRRAILFIAVLFTAKFAAMGLLGEPVSVAVVSYRSIAYSLFLGMTLAGTPVLWRVLRRHRSEMKPLTWSMIPLGFAAMALLMLIPTGAKMLDESVAYQPETNIPLDALAGAAAYSAMVLPGVSGGTIKLALGRYEPTVWSIGQAGNSVNPLADAAPAGAWLPILLPYIAGAVVGLVIVSNLLKYLLTRFELPVTACLLGVLLGSILPIWPFDQWPPTGVLLASLTAAIIGFAGVYALTLWEHDDARSQT